MEYNDIMAALEEMGSEQSKKILAKHGAREPFFGVKVGDMKKLLKKVKKNNELAVKLYDSGNTDAMYMAAFVAIPGEIEKMTLEGWVDKAYWHMLSEYAVAWVASESRYGFELARQWINSGNEQIAVCGWSVLSSLAAIKPDEELDLEFFKNQLHYISSNIHNQPNRVRYAMNNFVISTASYIIPLYEIACESAEAIGKVKVDMGGSACKVPYAPEYIEKVASMNSIGKKRKTSFC